MNGAGTSDAGAERRGHLREPAVLPQWAMELMRPAVRLLVSGTLWRVRYHGIENIPLGGRGLIIAANHQTYLDPFWVGVAVRRPVRYLAWNAAFKRRALGKPIELLGAWPLDVEKSDPAAYRRSLQWLREGGAIMIFPEGGRAKSDGEMSKFKTGVARLALEANVPILPVTIRGGHAIWPKDRRWPRAGRVEIIYHPPRTLAIRPGEDARQCARREAEALAATIKSAL